MDERPHERYGTREWTTFCDLVSRGAGVADVLDDAATAAAATAHDRAYLLGLAEHHRENTVPFLVDDCALAGKSVLEVGAGTAGLAVALAEAGVREVIGAEPNAKNYEAGVWRAKAHRVDDRVRLCHVPDTTRLPFADDSFDAAVCSSVLQYVPRRTRPALLDEMHRVVKPGGLVIVCGSGNGLLPGGPHSKRWWSNLTPDRAERLGHTHGVTYWEIDRVLRRRGATRTRRGSADGAALARWLERAERRGRDGRSAWGRLALGAAYRAMDATWCRGLGVPIEAFLPYMTVAYEKAPPSPNGAGGPSVARGGGGPPPPPPKSGGGGGGRGGRWLGGVLAPPPRPRRTAPPPPPRAGGPPLGGGGPRPPRPRTEEASDLGPREAPCWADDCPTPLQSRSASTSKRGLVSRSSSRTVRRT